MNDEAERKVFGARVITLASGQQAVIDARGMIRLHVVTTGTLTVSRVDMANATAHTTSLVTALPHDVDWPFFLVSVAGASARVGLV